MDNEDLTSEQARAMEALDLLNTYGFFCEDSENDIKEHIMEFFGE